MKFLRSTDNEILAQADELFYEVLWKPFGIPNVRHEFENKRGER